MYASVEMCNPNQINEPPSPASLRLELETAYRIKIITSRGASSSSLGATLSPEEGNVWHAVAIFEQPSLLVRVVHTDLVDVCVVAVKPRGGIMCAGIPNEGCVVSRLGAPSRVLYDGIALIAEGGGESFILDVAVVFAI